MNQSTFYTKQFQIEATCMKIIIAKIIRVIENFFFVLNNLLLLYKPEKRIIYKNVSRIKYMNLRQLRK